MVVVVAAVLVVALIWPREVLDGFYAAVNNGATPWLVPAAGVALLLLVRKRPRE